ncbi:Ca2+ sensor (EF-Hand superfamily) [Olea europaea subsp. europaea]|uniref:Ca2+ sensor (EF-Hand superfamily) n=1 Tax=Olea europaea subsp. europaea TaxID=158383 RepID=A0A8S0S9X7_OLEEU|nr:Ca2+ sensor (EF-Hand superfamily) [Olea europaea subsp. europaea]
MERIKELAIAYYERATEEEKDTGRENFRRLDRNGDGKVCLLEFKKSVSSWLSSEKVFKQIDANGEGTLDFNDVLAIYNMKMTNLSLVCNGCDDALHVHQT